MPPAKLGRKNCRKRISLPITPDPMGRAAPVALVCAVLLLVPWGSEAQTCQLWAGAFRSANDQSSSLLSLADDPPSVPCVNVAHVFSVFFAANNARSVGAALLWSSASTEVRVGDPPECAPFLQNKTIFLFGPLSQTFVADQVRNLSSQIATLVTQLAPACAKVSLPFACRNAFPECVNVNDTASGIEGTYR